MRIGLGYDIHRLVEGRKFLLGGIEIPSTKGPLGHSDGDALLHAVTDALLGAAGLGDIGEHFSDKDPRWKDADSTLFIQETLRLLQQKNLTIENIDINIHLENPKLAPHKEAIRQNLTRLLGISADRLNLKAKTGEGLDAIGRGEAIAVHAVVLLASYSNTNPNKSA